MTAREKRDELLAIAGILNGHRAALAKVINEINAAVTLLVNEADRHLMSSVEEASTPAKKQKVTYEKLIEAVSDGVMAQVEHIAKADRKRKGKRKPRALTPEQRKAIGERLKRGRDAKAKAKERE